MSLRFVEIVLEKLRDHQLMYEDLILAGGFEEHSQYKFSAGKLIGIREAESIITRTYKEMYESIEIKKGVTNVEEFGDNEDA